MNLELITGILEAFRKQKQRNTYQLYGNPRTGSKSTLLKYLHLFIDSGLLEVKAGKQVGLLTEKIYTLTEKGKEASELSRKLSAMLENQNDSAHNEESMEKL